MTIEPLLKNFIILSGLPHAIGPLFSLRAPFRRYFLLHYFLHVIDFPFQLAETFPRPVHFRSQLRALLPANSLLFRHNLMNAATQTSGLLELSQSLIKS